MLVSFQTCSQFIRSVWCCRTWKARYNSTANVWMSQRKIIRGIETERQGVKNKECHAEHERHKSCQWVIKSQSVSKQHLLPLAPITHLPFSAMTFHGIWDSPSLSLSLSPFSWLLDSYRSQTFIYQTKPKLIKVVWLGESEHRHDLVFKALSISSECCSPERIWMSLTVDSDQGQTGRPASWCLFIEGNEDGLLSAKLNKDSV